MTDRHAGYTVTLAEDIREDDAQATLNAIAMIKGVVSVTPVVCDFALQVAQERRDEAWREALRRMAREGLSPLA